MEAVWPDIWDAPVWPDSESDENNVGGNGGGDGGGGSGGGGGGGDQSSSNGGGNQSSSNGGGGSDSDSNESSAIVSATSAAPYLPDIVPQGNWRGLDLDGRQCFCGYGAFKRVCFGGLNCGRRYYGCGASHYEAGCDYEEFVDPPHSRPVQKFVAHLWSTAAAAGRARIRGGRRVCALEAANADLQAQAQHYRRQATWLKIALITLLLGMLLQNSMALEN